MTLKSFALCEPVLTSNYEYNDLTLSRDFNQQSIQWFSHILHVCTWYAPIRFSFKMNAELECICPGMSHVAGCNRLIAFTLNLGFQCLQNKAWEAIERVVVQPPRVVYKWLFWRLRVLFNAFSKDNVTVRRIYSTAMTDVQHIKYSKPSISDRRSGLLYNNQSEASICL